ncbi:MAG: aryl-sulfate sulfotransferase [Bacteroidales bacterium]
MKNFFLLLFGIFMISTIHSQDQTVGLFYNQNPSFNGYSLFAPFRSTTTYLIDNCGRVVNSWESEYLPSCSVYLLENGHLLRTCLIESPTFTNIAGLGGRVEEYDWDGNLVWHYEYHAINYQQHHDIEPLPNGNILLLVWDAYTPNEAVQAGRIPANLLDSFWSEKIVEIKPLPNNEAEIVWEWKLWDHLIQDFNAERDNFGIVSEHPELIDINFSAETGTNSLFDWIHGNAIDYNEELDQIILSSRNLSEFYIIDHSTTTEEAAGHSGGTYNKGGDILYRYGNPKAYKHGINNIRQLSFQHNPHWIKKEYNNDWQIMVFSNLHRVDTSAVIIITPPVSEPVALFTPTGIRLRA